MASFNGFAALESIGSHEELFRPISADVVKAARAISIKYLKGKGITLSHVRGMRKVFGKGDEFALLVDGMKDSEIKSVVTKLDKNFPDLKTATASELRRHLRSLADGDAEPTAKKTPVRKSKSKTTAQREPNRLSSGAMTAVRKRSA